MNCYDCATLDHLARSAVGVCHDCGAAVCETHAVDPRPPPDPAGGDPARGARRPAGAGVALHHLRRRLRRGPPCCTGRPPREHRDVMSDDGDVGFAPLDWADWATRFVLFTGKGGVGKTTVASGVAVALADAGPAGAAGQHRPGLQPGRRLPDRHRRHTRCRRRWSPGLDLMDLDPQAAADAYRRTSHRPATGPRSRGELAAMRNSSPARAPSRSPRSTRSPACLPTRPPTGATTTSCSTPRRPATRCGSWPARRVVALPVGQPGGDHLPRAARRAARTTALYERAVAVLADPAADDVGARRPPRPPARSPKRARAAAELAELGLTNQRLVINGVLADPLAGDRVAESYAAAQRDALAHLPAALAGCRRRWCRSPRSTSSASTPSASSRTPTATARTASRHRGRRADLAGVDGPRSSSSTARGRARRHPRHRQGRRRQDQHRGAHRRRSRPTAASPSISPPPTPPAGCPPRRHACPTP